MGIGRALELCRIPLRNTLNGVIEVSKRVVMAVGVAMGVAWAAGACDAGKAGAVSAPAATATVSDVDAGVVPDDGVILTPCDDEDGGDPVPGVDGCYWDASERGNGQGSDVIVWWTH